MRRTGGKCIGGLVQVGTPPRMGGSKQGSVGGGGRKKHIQQ